MFIENKYTKYYYAIIEHGQSRNLLSRKKAKDELGYVELHHIIPISLGGSNNKENTVYLTAKEHYICHHLLTKMVTGVNYHKMIKAAHCMVRSGTHQSRYKITATVFARLRKDAATSHSALVSGTHLGENNPFYNKQHTKETRDKISKANTGRLVGLQRPKEFGDKISKALRGVAKTEAHKEAIKESWDRAERSGENHPMFGKNHTQETRDKMKTSAAERWTDQARKEFSNKIKETRPKFVCPHCSKNITGSWNYQQHISKCSLNIE